VVLLVVLIVDWTLSKLHVMVIIHDVVGLL
jgi:hypothetical protein